MKIDQLLRTAQRHLPIVHFLADSVLWIVGVPFATWLRYDFDTSRIGDGTVRMVVAAVTLQGIVGLALGQYRGRWKYGTFDELGVVAATAATVGMTLTVVFWRDLGVPRSVPLLAMGISLLGQIAIRSAWRLYTAQQRGTPTDTTRRLLVVGAGDGAEQILRILTHSSDPQFLPVAMVDDDPDKRQRRMFGIRVKGRLSDLTEVARDHQADSVLIAIPSAPGSLIRTVTEAAESAGLTVFVLPPLTRLLGGTLAADDIRPVQPDDLLGRRPVDIDPSAIAGYVTGRRVLVTGAGGSIGSEICRQLARFEPSALLMLDRDESGIHGTQLSIEGRAMLDDPNLILADIRDAERISEVFATHRPDVVFHTAALKHLPLLESHPAEGWKTNVLGTRNLLEAAATCGVERFVNVSTDKAANPTSVLGYTKRITERMTAWANSLGDTTFVSVRFGNVLDSNGSVLRSFVAQAANGGPITVTHPDVTRYFMTIEEASRLVIHAAAIGDPGEVMILDMGEPVKIIDVARRFADQHEPPLDIAITGLRRGEKLHEELICDDERGTTRGHPMIRHVSVLGLDPRDLPSGRIPSIPEMREIVVPDVIRG